MDISRLVLFNLILSNSDLDEEKFFQWKICTLDTRRVDDEFSLLYRFYFIVNENGMKCLEEYYWSWWKTKRPEKREIGKEINFSFCISFWLWFLLTSSLSSPSSSCHNCRRLSYTNEKIMASFYLEAKCLKKLTKKIVIFMPEKLSNETLSGIK